MTGSGARLLAALGIVLGIAGCGKRANETQRTGDSSADTAAWHAGLTGRPEALVSPASALFAPGAQSAWAWLPDRSFWNGDFGIEFYWQRLPNPSHKPPVFFYPREVLGASLPATRISFSSHSGRSSILALMPWSGDDRDTLGWGLVEFDFGGLNATTTSDSFGIAVRSAGEAWHFIDPRAPAGDKFRYEWRKDRLLRNGRTLALFDGPVAGAAPVEAPAQTLVPIARIPIAPRPGTVTHWRIWLAPVGGLAPDAVPPGRNRPTDEIVRETAAAWGRELEKGASYRVPDPDAQATLDAAVVCLLGNRERRNGQLHYLGNPFQYRDLYLRDGARVVRALDLLGRPDLASGALATLFEFQWPSGPFLSQRGQLDGTGQALWALAQHASLARGDVAIKSLAESALRGARWIQSMRGYSTLRGGPAAGLLPFSDPRDNENLRGHLLGSDAWAIAGLEGLADVLRAGGRATVADSLVQEAGAYRRRLLEVWDREARRQGRPLPPSIERGAQDWGNLSAAYPCAVISSGDPRAVALDRAVRARFEEGLPTYGTRDSVHLYLGFDLTQAALRRGERAAVNADLEADLDHILPNGMGLEILGRSLRDFGGNLPPHGTFAAMYVDLVRSMIVYEERDSLVLLAGVPSRWLEEGTTAIEAQGAPTRFGTLALRALRTGPATLDLTVDLPAPARVAFPEELNVLGAAATSGSGTARLLGPHTVALPAGAATWRLQVAADKR